MGSLSAFLEDKLFLSPGELIQVLLALLFITNTLHRLIRYHRLSHVPGPFLAGWTGLWEFTHIWRGTYLLKSQALFAKYGPVVRLGPNKIIVSDVDAVYRISNVRSQYRKGSWYPDVGRVTRQGESILTLADPEARRDRKKIIMSGYSGRGVEDQEEGVGRAITAFKDLIERKYLSTAGKFVPLDMDQKAHFLALDAIGEIAYSQSFKSLEEDADTVGLIDLQRKMLTVNKLLGLNTWVYGALRRWPLYYLLPHDVDESGLTVAVGLVKTLLTERANPNAPPKQDMLQSFLSHGLHGFDLQQEIGIQFFAGSDTVASQLRTTFLSLLNNPRIYHLLQSELDTAFAASQISTPTILDSEARALPYLQAVVREGLRLFPSSTVFPFPKVVPPRGIQFVAPERWLEDVEEGRLEEMQRRVELAFGSGQYMCVGRGIALMEIRKIVAELMRRYNWALADPTKMPRVWNPAIWAVENFWVTVEKR